MAHAQFDTAPAATPRTATPGEALFPRCALGPASSADSQHSAIGTELGWDYARHGLIPPPEHLSAGHPVRQGWEAGRRQFVQRARAATPAISLTLQTRLQAWLRGQDFETMSLTPNLVAQLVVSHCPVTRTALVLPGSAPQRPGALRLALNDAPADSRGAPTAVLARLRNDAAYAAGHVALLSPLADAAKADGALADVLEALQRQQGDALHPGTQPHVAVDATRDTRAPIDRLGVDALSRLAVLLSFVTPLSHAHAASLPLLVLPPNRLRLLNPIQALQAFLTLQLARSGWSKRLPALEQIMTALGIKSPAVHSELRAFFYTLMSCCIASGRPGRDAAEQQAWRWTLEDAWRHSTVQSAWQRLALQITPEQAEALVQRAAEAGLCPQQVQQFSVDQATDGWGLPAADASAHGRGPGASRRAVRRQKPMPTPMPKKTPTLSHGSPWADSDLTPWSDEGTRLQPGTPTLQMPLPM